MGEFYFLHVRDDPGAPVAYGSDDPLRDELLVEPGRVDDWEDLKLVVQGGAPRDFLANNVGVRLCSDRLRTAIEGAKSGSDELQWLQAEVLDELGNTHTFHVLHFPRLPDVLDADRTIKSRGWFVVKPVLARGRVGLHRVFSFPGGVTRTIVAKNVREAIEQAGCSGIDFAPVTLA